MKCFDKTKVYLSKNYVIAASLEVCMHYKTGICDFRILNLQAIFLVKE